MYNIKVHSVLVLMRKSVANASCIHRQYLTIARERFAVFWNYEANNERLLIIKHGTNLYCSAEMITSKQTAQKNKMAPVTCDVGRSIILIYAIAFLDLR